MKFTERTFIMLMVFGIVMQLFGIEGYEFCLLIGMLLLGIMYLFLGTFLLNGIRFRDMFRKATYANIPGQNLGIGAITGFAYFIMVVGVIYKIQCWPGAVGMLFGSVAASVFITVTLYAIGRHDKPVLYKNVLNRTSVIIPICVVLAYLK